jgi:hypothetical protein
MYAGYGGADCNTSPWEGKAGGSKGYIETLTQK